jgi:hypothetical protein
MAKVVARLRRIVSARVAGAIMDRVMPVVVVIRVLAIPAAVMRLERVMCLAHTGVRAGDNNALPSESERPNVRRMRVLDARLDRRGTSA